MFILNLGRWLLSSLQIHASTLFQMSDFLTIKKQYCETAWNAHPPTFAFMEFEQ